MTVALAQNELAFLQTNLVQLYDPRSVLSDAAKGTSRIQLETALRGEMPAWDAAASLLQATQDDLASRLVRLGAKPLSSPSLSGYLGRFLEGTRSTGIDLSDVSVDDLVGDELIGLKTFETLPNLLGVITMDLELWRLFGTRPAGSGLRAYHLAAPAILIGGAILQCLAKGLRVEIVAGPVSLQRMRDLLAEDALVLCISPLPHDAEGYVDLHPYLFTLHDLFHLLALRRVPRDVRRLKVDFYDALVAVPEGLRGKDADNVTLSILQGASLNAKDFCELIAYAASAYLPPGGFSEFRRALTARFQGRSEGPLVAASFGKFGS